MSSVKAILSVILKANEVVVAEVEDATLWQNVLTAINSGISHLDPPPDQTKTDPNTLAGNPRAGFGGLNADSGPLGQLAQQLGLDTAFVQGACSPTTEAPYLHLDSHYWEEMKKQVPQRGPLSIAPIIAPATLIALWFGKANLGIATQAQAKAVLATINLEDPNASRSIQNTSWLQSRAGGQIVLNPAEISKAVKLAKCFCSKDWSAWKGTTVS